MSSNPEFTKDFENYIPRPGKVELKHFRNVDDVRELMPYLRKLAEQREPREINTEISVLSATDFYRIVIELIRALIILYYVVKEKFIIITNREIYTKATIMQDIFGYNPATEIILENQQIVEWKIDNTRKDIMILQSIDGKFTVFTKELEFFDDKVKPRKCKCGNFLHASHAFEQMRRKGMTVEQFIKVWNAEELIDIQCCSCYQNDL